jgi:hypothetical protein
MDSSILQTVLVLRGIERLVAVLIGGLLAYLGYRLFLNIPTRTRSDGQVILPGNISIYLSRVGPGVFFALFGTIVLTLALYMAVRIDPNGTAGVPRIVSAEAGGAGVEAQSVAADRQRLRRELATLNRLPATLRTDLPDNQRRAIEDALPRIKLALMKEVWGPDWGDWKRFESWVMEEDAEGKPPELAQAVDYFRYTEEPGAAK